MLTGISPFCKMMFLSFFYCIILSFLIINHLCICVLLDLQRESMNALNSKYYTLRRNVCFLIVLYTLHIALQVHINNTSDCIESPKHLIPSADLLLNIMHEICVFSFCKKKRLILCKIFNIKKF